MRVLVALLALALVGGGCRNQPQALPEVDSAAEAARILRDHYATAEEMDAEVYLIIVPPEEEHVSFSLQMTVTPEHGVILDGFKKGFEILDGVIDPEGGIMLVMTREKFVVEGDLDAVAAARDDGEETTIGLFVTQLPRIVEEVQSGPVPEVPRYELEEVDGRRALRCIAEAGEALCLLDEAGERVEEKIVYRGHGAEAEELLRLVYKRHLRTSGLLRAKAAEVKLPGNETKIYVKLSELTLPEVGAPLRVRLPERPADWPVRALDEWLQTLLEEQRSRTAADGTEAP